MNILKQFQQFKPLIIKKRLKQKAIKYYQDTYSFTLTDKQLELIESKDSIVKSSFSRQEGLTTACMIKAIEYAIKNNDSKVYFVTYSNSVAKIVKAKIIDILYKNKLNNYVFNSSTFRIEFFNKSCINIVDRNINNFIGINIDCFIIDVSKHLLTEELIEIAERCTIKNKNKQIIVGNQEDKNIYNILKNE